jgi:fructose-specific phosphotransferase system IIC component
MYLIIDAIWVVLSLLQLYWVRRHDSNPIGALKCWATNTIIISVLDFLLVVLIGVDYSKHCIPSLTESVCTNVVIPVLIIAARGFVLWFVNVIFAYVILQIAKTLHDVSCNNVLLLLCVLLTVKTSTASYIKIMEQSR